MAHAHYRTLLKDDVDASSDVVEIADFDESDVSANGVVVGTSLSSGCINSAVVPQRSVPNHLLMVSLLEHLCSVYVPDPAKANQLFKSICSQLAKMKVMSPLSYIDEVSSIRTQYRLAFSRLLETALLSLHQESNKSQLVPMLGERVNMFFSPRLPQQIPVLTASDMVQLQTNRYSEEFEELGRIGKGGFGHVYKVRHKLDGCLYAIKKIVIKSANPDVWMRLLREVKYLANLSHPHIIGYNAAWLEYSENINETYVWSASNKSMLALEYSKQDVSEDYMSIGSNESKSSGIIFQYSVSESSVHHDTSQQSSLMPSLKSQLVVDTDEFSCPKSCRRSVSSSNIQVDKQHAASSDSDSKGKKTNMSVVKTRKKYLRRSFSEDGTINPGKALLEEATDFREENLLLQCRQVILYIQMQLCSRTLSDWLTNEYRGKSENQEPFNIVNSSLNLKILKQILKGVEYIHSEGLIHRDLKPKNIFLSDDLYVRIGDFGLARGLPDDIETPLTPAPGIVGHTSGVGTSSYAAPEQLEGHIYDGKADMYSIGMIMFEMFHPFGTQMERAHWMKQVRIGNIPDVLAQYYPIQTKFLRRLLHILPTERPTAADLLQSELFLSNEQIIKHLDKKVQEQNDVITAQEVSIRELRILLALRDNELTQLKNKFDALL